MKLPNFAHTAIIIGATGSGKTYFIMDLLKTIYEDYFDIVIILCPTFSDNSTYQDNIHLFDKNKEGTRFYYYDFPEGGLSTINPKIYGRKDSTLPEVLEHFSKGFKGNEHVLFIIDDLASDVETSRKHTYLSKLAISGRHIGQYIWVLTQKYNMICKDIRSQSMWICSFYTKDKKSFMDMLDENDVGLTNEQKIDIRKFCKNKNKVILKLFDNTSYALLD